MKYWSGCSPLVLAAAFVATGATAQSEATASAGAVRVGHWLEIRGHFLDAASFEADEVRIVQPQKYDVLIGTADDGGEGTFRLLARRVVPDRRTRWRNVEPGSVDGTRVKVEGFSNKGSSRFVAAKVSHRGPGRERIAGRVERLRSDASGLRATVLGFDVLLPETVTYQEPLDRIALAAPRARAFNGDGTSEDDLFGRGIRIAKNLALLGQLETRYSSEENFDLDVEDADGPHRSHGPRCDLRLEWGASERLTAVVEGRHAGLERGR